MNVVYPFTEAEMNAAAAEWGCNCGPAALAFALQIKLDAVRPHIPDFAKKGYTSPRMMKAALTGLGRSTLSVMPTQHRDSLPPHPRWTDMFDELMALTRVQWTGPWTKAGSNGKWAYSHTHWIATWNPASFGGPCYVFDCNGGIQTYDEWLRTIVPAITREIQRADGGWYPTHVWRLL